MKTRQSSSQSHSTVRIGRSLTGGNSSAGKKRGSIAATSINEFTDNGVLPPVQLQTINFSYSDAVSRAFRRIYRAPQFGPPSAPKKKQEPFWEIERLSDLYSDFRLMTRLYESNQKYIEKLREQLASEEAPESIENNRRGTKLQRMSLKNPPRVKMSQKERVRAGSVIPVTNNNSTASSVPKLPPISSNNNITKLPPIK